MSARISSLPTVVSANILDTDILPIVTGIAANLGVTKRVSVTELRLKLGTTPPTGGRTVTSAATYLLNNAAYNVKDYGAFGDNATDDRAAIALTKTNADLVGAAVYFPPGSYKVNSNLTLASCVFDPGAKMVLATGTVLTLQGTPVAHPFQQIFSCVGTATVAPAGGVLSEIPVGWFGAVGDGVTDDTAAVGKAINAAATAIYLPTPTGGVQVGESPTVQFDGREYVLSSGYSMGSYHIIRSRTRARIRQTTTTAITFDFGNSVRVLVEGIQFIGGKHAIRFYNNNIDTSRLTLSRCSFQLASDFAVRVGGSGTAGGGPAVRSSINTLAATTNTFTRASGSFITDGFVAGMTLTPEGFSNNMITTIQSVAALTITVNDTRTAEGSAASRDLEGTYVFDTNSANVLIEDCEFYWNAKVLSSISDQTTLRDCWVSLDAAHAATGAPQIVNLSFQMSITNLFTVTPPSGIGTGMRWMDNYRRIYAREWRFGAEGGGISGIWQRGAPSASSSDAQGTAIEIIAGIGGGGGSAPTGFVQFREHVPELLVLQGIRGLGSTNVIVNAAAGALSGNIANLTTYLNSYPPDLHTRFRFVVSGNLMSSPGAVPPEIKVLLFQDRDRILANPLLTGTLFLNQNTATPMLAVTFDTGAGNDDNIAIHLEYSVEDQGGANRLIEAGFGVLVASRNSAAVTVGTATKGTFAQALTTAVTDTITLTAVVVGNVVTFKVTANTSNGDNSQLVFRARVIKPPTRPNSTYAVDAAVVFDQAGR